MADDIAAVLAYLSELVEQDRAFDPYVEEVAFLDHRDDAVHTTHRSEALRRVAASDLLHADERLAREGNLWIIGTVDGVRYRWPIRQRTVTLGTRVHKSVAVTPLSPWGLTSGLVEQSHLHRISLGDQIWRQDYFGLNSVEQVFKTKKARDDQHLLASFVARYLDAAGLPQMPIRSSDSSPAATEPHVLFQRGFFLERNPFTLDRASALAFWRNHAPALRNTALGATYRTASRVAVDAGAPRPVVRSPLPLNNAQRQAIEVSWKEPVMLISGPPGTGKSHVVAAAAIDQIAAGKSVLIASQSVHARDAVLELLERYPMVEALRFGDDGATRALGDKLASGVTAPVGKTEEQEIRDRCSNLEAQINRHRKRIAQRIADLANFEQALTRRHDVPLWLAQRDLTQVDVAALRTTADKLAKTGWAGRLSRRRARNSLRRDLGQQAPVDSAQLRDLADAIAADQLVEAIADQSLGLDDLWVALDRLEEDWRLTIGELLEVERRDRVSSKNRQALQQLATALRLSTAERRRQLAALGGGFLEVVPLWIGTLGEIEAVLPIQPALFDLVILDEASQISQLSAVPALARARRAIIVGDSRQLRHVSFVSVAAQQEAAARHELSPELASRLNERANSIFDAATAVAPVVELDEHFRSVPHIIGFSDRQFYGNRLRLMTQHPGNEDLDAIEVVRVNGSRDEHQILRAEVDEVVKLVSRLIASGQSSIGVVSPFRGQADAIENEFVARFRLEDIAQHQLRVGTVHSFQGTERDHMIISLGVGPDDKGAMQFAQDPSLFNVMVTRARSKVTVVTALGPKTTPSGLIADYLRHAEEPPLTRNETLGGSGWTERLATELAGQSTARVITGYEVAGEMIDIVVGTGSEAFGIETEVHRGGPQRHIERRLALQRAGWDIVSWHRATCFGREETVIAELLARIARTWP